MMSVFDPTGRPARFTADGGADYFDGGAGNDILIGDGGDDILSGGADNDQLYGDDFADDQAGYWSCQATTSWMAGRATIS